MCLLLALYSFSCVDSHFTTGLLAQPVRFLEAYEDGDASIQQNIGEILSDSLHTHPDSLIRQLPVIMAYHRWAQMATIEWSTPLVKRIEIWKRKAQSDFLMGMYQAYLVPKYSRMESGVLPLAQQSKAYLDSASVNYSKLLRHIVDQTKFNFKLDSAITVTLSSEIEMALQKTKEEGYIQPLQQFDPDSLVKSELKPFEKRDLFVQNALGWWFAKAVVYDTTDIKKHEPKNLNLIRSDH